jgi:hypothetical protein
MVIRKTHQRNYFSKDENLGIHRRESYEIRNHHQTSGRMRGALGKSGVLLAAALQGILRLNVGVGRAREPAPV